MELVKEIAHPAGIGGVQKLYRSSNGFGASVVKSPYSYGSEEGLWELAVIEWDEDKYQITYDTEVTSDVIGHLTLEGVEVILSEIEAIKPEGVRDEDETRKSN